ncbi:LysR family transcriptional regulator [Pseudomarimonas salicorniae]|uniref:LysR family transcriptional regulator n=1 Tax=Pseudomarimonas salicorniae TaxID=2933270 RepID=A0ABT0GKG7_9GAMM|nr:LysR family transcriptional regulator [Lysobacter sp. CAU 1642]MCK7595026.1 LysR family transcriptional regulator [Lysobacter sp. CAU 1642]
MNESPTDLALFVAVAESGQLAQAARLLGISPAGASAALKRLEQQLGARLVLRSTRRLRLSVEGERYLPHARAVLAALRAGREALARDAPLQGWVRISAPADLGRNRLLPLLEGFSGMHPGVRFQLSLEDTLSDFFAQPVDLALRYGLLDDDRVVAQPLRVLQRWLCAAPDYLERHGVPDTPQALREHATVCYMQRQRAVTRWRLSHVDGDTVEVDVEPRWVFNDAEMVRRWVLAAHGIALRVEADIGEDIAAGRLRRLMPDWQGESTRLSLVYPDRALSPALRAVVDHLSAALG